MAGLAETPLAAVPSAANALVAQAKAIAASAGRRQLTAIKDIVIPLWAGKMRAELDALAVHWR
jgi:hypothetical protein